MSDYSLLKTESLDLDLHIAVFLAEASQAAYGRVGPDDPSPNDDVPTPTEWAAKTGFGTANTFNHRNVQGFWCLQDGVALLAFRGTSNPSQWLRDARFFPAPYPWGWLHVGFRDGLNAQTAELQKFLAAVTAANAPYLWITGHSLGGALAVVAASKLKILQPSIVPPHVYTYGQPRVGLSGFSEEFHDEFPDRLLRFINQQDIVPRVPLDPIYHHTGTPKHITKPGVIEFAMAEAAPELSVEQSERVEALRRALSLPFEETIPEAVPEAASSAGVSLVEVEPPQLSPQQFAELQYGLGASPASEEGDFAEASIPEAFIDIPAIEDHFIANYIAELKKLAGSA